MSSATTAVVNGIQATSGSTEGGTYFTGAWALAIREALRCEMLTSAALPCPGTCPDSLELPRAHTLAWWGGRGSRSFSTTPHLFLPSSSSSSSFYSLGIWVQPRWPGGLDGRLHWLVRVRHGRVLLDGLDDRVLHARGAPRVRGVLLLRALLRPPPAADLDLSPPLSLLTFLRHNRKLPPTPSAPQLYGRDRAGPSSR